ncbi:MAG: XRE family transcriptional regulator [Bacteroidetes bacterium]|nr:XRE family transcriptional regulator [Bacteroidota bacterium]MBU1720128.1 XRE family transcriptional regulator [Bacteroidota bacterium]
MSNAGIKLRELRENQGFSLRQVASIIDVDTAILSKMERGERRLSLEILEKLAKLYNYNLVELKVLFLSDKVLYEIGEDELALRALKAAEVQVEYKLAAKTDKKKVLNKISVMLSEIKQIRKAWIFGSFARGEEKPESDIDIAIQADKQFSYFDLAELQFQIESVISRKVDIGFLEAMKKGVAGMAKHDLILIYERRS